MAGLSQRRAALVAKLRVPKSRAREESVLVEGVRAVNEALAAGVEVRFAVTSPRLVSTAEGKALAGRLGATDAARVDDGELGRLSDTEHHQGVLLVCAEPAASLGRIEPTGRYLVLDGVQDPGNAGTLVRAAVAFGLDAAICLEGTVDPWSAKTVRSSAGMIFRLPVVRAAALDAMARLAEVRVPMLVADARGEDVAARRMDHGFALVVGNEGAGVRPQVAHSAAATVAVRMPGPAESLNVAMAGSILLYALTREGATATG
jgi:TrmH family RNA methyltransferase